MKKKKSENIFPWKIIYNGFDPDSEGLKETICALGNGYLGTRAAWPEYKADNVHYPGTYLAGVYNTLETKIAGKKIYNEDLVNCPNWLFIKVGYVDEKCDDEIIFCKQILDLKKGILERKKIVKDNKGKITSIEEKRIVSVKDPHCAAIKYTIKPKNYSDDIVVSCGIDGTIENTGVARYRELSSKHLKGKISGSFGKNGIYVNAETVTSGIEISMASKVRIFSKGKELHVSPKLKKKAKSEAYFEFCIPFTKGQSIEIEKNVSIFTSKEIKKGKTLRSAISHSRNSLRFDVIARKHFKQWEKLWGRSDIEIKGDKISENLLRLHGFHLLQTANKHNKDIDSSIPARGLNGEAYRGHIFWDEMYALPFFESHFPKIAEALLLYRYRRLKKAREYAKAEGYSGAMFPWQSGDTGTEETQIVHLNPVSGRWGPDYSRNQRHVSFAIAYNVWRHWIMTGDKNFLIKYGAEIILSIAKFASSLCKYDKKDKRYHTEGLMGPDEFHEKLPGSKKAGLEDNAYSNILIVWTLRKAMKALDILPEKEKIRIKRKIKLRDPDISKWEEIIQKINIIFDNNGIISQFKGYFDLKELDWNKYREKYGDIHRLDRILKAEGKSPDEYKVAKQADVMMIFYLLPMDEIKEIFDGLGYRFNNNILKKNFDYYVKRTSHGSTLSKVVYCYILTLLGKKKKAWKWFQEVLSSDIQDAQGGTTPEGIHTGVMGGSIDIVVRGFAGIDVREGYINISPSLPEPWEKVRFNISYGKNRIYFLINKLDSEIVVRPNEKANKGEKVKVKINGKVINLTANKKYVLK